MKRKKNIQKILKKAAINEVAWMKFCKNANQKKELMIRQGYRGKKLNESFAGMIDGLVRAFFGSGITSGGDPTQSMENFKEIAKQQFLQAVVKKLGFDEKSAMFSIVRNALERMIEQLGDEKVKKLLMDREGDCYDAAEPAAEIFIGALYEGMTEQGLEKIIDGMMSDFQGLKDNKIFGGVYIKIRESISSAVENILEDKIGLKENIVEVFCDTSLVEVIENNNPGAIPNVNELYQKLLQAFGM